MQKFLAAMQTDEKTIAISKEFYEDYILETDQVKPFFSKIISNLFFIII